MRIILAILALLPLSMIGQSIYPDITGSTIPYYDSIPIISIEPPNSFYYREYDYQNHEYVLLDNKAHEKEILSGLIKEYFDSIDGEIIEPTFKGFYEWLNKE